MPDSINHHAALLRQTISMHGSVEIQEAGCDSPSTLAAAEILTTPLQDHTARHALRQARARTLVIAAVNWDDPAAVGRCAIEEASLVIVAWARTFVAIENRGGHVSYRPGV